MRSLRACFLLCCCSLGANTLRAGYGSVSQTTGASHVRITLESADYDSGTTLYTLHFHAEGYLNGAQGHAEFDAGSVATWWSKDTPVGTATTFDATFTQVTTVSSYGFYLIVGGSYTYKVFDWSGTLKKVKLALRNTSGYPIEYRLMQDGADVGGITLGPGQSIIQTFTVPSNSAVSVVALVDGLLKDGPVWVEQPGAVTPALNSPVGGPYTPTSTSGDPPQSTPDPSPGAAPQANPANDTSNSGKLPVYGWNPSTDRNNATSAATQTDLLTNGTLRQGVDMIDAKLDKIANELGSGGASAPGSGGTGSAGGSGLDLTAVVNKLQEIKDQDAQFNSAEQGIRDVFNSEKALYNSIPGTTEMLNAGNAAADDLSAKYPSVTYIAPPSVPSDTPDFTISFPTELGGHTFDLNPFRGDRLGTIVDWFRAATAWLVIATFGLWASNKVGEWSRGLSTVQQAKGNPILGGTGAQATALVAAGLMTAVIVTFVVALMGWLAGDFGFSTMLTTIGGSPLSGIPGGVAWMLDRVFPVSIIIAALTGRITWNVYASKIFAVVMSVIRFIVP